MKTAHPYPRAFAFLIIFAIGQISLQAASPAIDLITTFSIPGFGTDATGINEAGTIVGSSKVSAATFKLQGYARMRNGDFSLIVHPNEDGRYTVPSAINNSGLIAGYYYTGGHLRGFFLSGETYTDFEVPGACETKITGLNDAGDFAGQVYLPDGRDCTNLASFVSIGGNVTIFTIPGATSTSARGMNNLGQVVGSYYDGHQVHGFLRNADGDITSPIDYPGAVATAISGINDKGWMVGYYDDTVGDFHGVFWQSPTKPLAYDTGGSRFTYLEGINNRGLLCGSYAGDGGVLTGLLSRVRRQ